MSCWALTVLMKLSVGCKWGTRCLTTTSFALQLTSMLNLVALDVP